MALRRRSRALPRPAKGPGLLCMATSSASTRIPSPYDDKNYRLNERREGRRHARSAAQAASMRLLARGHPEHLRGWNELEQEIDEQVAAPPPPRAVGRRRLAGPLHKAFPATFIRKDLDPTEPGPWPPRPPARLGRAASELAEKNHGPT